MASTVEFYSFWRRRSIKPGTVLLEAFSGSGSLCNPEAIFQELSRSDDLTHLRFVWALADDESIREARRANTKARVRYVRVGSHAYYRALATSEFLINNATFPAQFSKRRGQTYLNTWHGTPLKKMGYHMPGGGPLARNVIRNFLQADYLLSGSEFMTETIYLDSYKLRNVFQGKFIEEGFPRIDHQFGVFSSASQTVRELTDAGIDATGRKIVLYAPTWRGSFYAPTNETSRLARLVDRLEAVLDPAEFCVLLKVHQVVYDQARSDARLAGKLVPNAIPTNAVLGVTDVLVTDYSSVFFDFLVSGRPVVFYATDQEDYADTRGLYMTPDELPGPISRHVPELARLIELAAHSGVAGFGADVTARYDACARRFCSWEDGSAAQRVVDVVFRGRHDGRRVRSAPSDGREKILLYPGGMRSNGITSSALNLLHAIDHSEYDVSVFYAIPKSDDAKGNEARIPEEARLFPRVGGLNGSKLSRRKWMLAFDGTRGRRHRIKRAALKALFRDEWDRCFGHAEFDYVVDFSGYGPMWPNIFLTGAAKSHSIWLHNDLAADALRETDGERKLEGGLRAVFETYDEFDRLVSVSPALAEVNAGKLGHYASHDKFVSAMNIINYDRVRALGFGRVPSGEVGSLTVSRGDVVKAVDQLMNSYDPTDVADEVERQMLARLLVDPDPATVTFVNVGRLSPEKNHERLLRAFRLVADDHPEARLVVLGSGPLLQDLITLSESLGLGDRVQLAGHQPNPFAVMAAADCFVLSSDYEGQPMVLLEARTLGLPVVSTDFDTARGALRDGDGLIVKRSVETLARGMIEFIEKGVPTLEFDPETYNQQALTQFLVAIGARPPQA
jgi:CDP-glycerol glycerophosphotransferase (TagB/SpsB family)/glycosyltransferase involved in cell wall biosynthesis